MKTLVQFFRRRGLELALLACVIHLAWLMYASAKPDELGVVPSERNEDFPNTFISRIHLDLTSPNHWVRLTWAGPRAAHQDIGPFRSSPGTGAGNDCNDVVESNCPGSQCTPKGVRKVEGFADYLKDTPEHRYVTWIDQVRQIGFHSCPSVEPYPTSAGCVRLEPYAARLIHDNSIKGKTEIVIDGTWTNPSEARAARSEERGELGAREQ
jgi:hypothetical protein